MEFSLGAQLYTVREYTQTPADAAQTFRRVAEIGYKSAQVSGFGPIDCHELYKISLDAGVTIALTHTPIDRIINETDAVMREHDVFGCKIIGLGGLANEMRDTPEHFFDAVKVIAETAEKISRNGFTFAYHNHAWEFCKIEGKTMMQYLLENTDPEAMKLTLDAYWIQHAGINPVEFIEENGNRICALHLKDMIPRFDNSTEFAEIGYGNMNYPSIIAAAKKKNIKWHMVEQDRCNRNPFDSLKMSYDYLDKLGCYK